MTNPWAVDGFWLKGSLHTHTTNSDGRLSPKEVVELYRGCGYDFVAFTDHGKVTTPDSVEADGMILIGGAEMGVPDTIGYTNYHLVAIGIEPDVPEKVDKSSPQAAIDSLRAAGALVYVAHPYWSGLRDEHLLPIEGIEGVEVFNTGCEYETRHGDSGQHWDWGLARGKQWKAIAVDDAHNYEWDACGGWTIVRAKERTAEAVLEALRAGLFYASSGPVIENLAISEGSIYLACSQAAAVHLIMPEAGRGWTSHRLCKRPPCEQSFSEIEIPAPPPGQIFRIEVVDEQGRKAWTNPMRLE